MGAQHSAYITVDRLGAPRCAGGICATARDLARLGQVLADGGAMRGKADHPRPLDRRHRAEWKCRCMGCRCLRALLSGTKDALPEQVVRGYWRGALLFALGIHGQYVFVDRRNQLVIVMMSSQVNRLDAELISLTMAAVLHFREIFALSQ